MGVSHDAGYDAPGRPRVAFVVVDDGLYTHRWLAPVLDRHDFETIGVTCLSPYWAVDFNPRGARGPWPVVCSRLAYYGLAATVRFACKAAWATVSDWRFRAGLGGEPGSLAAAAHARNVEVLRPYRSDLNDAEFRARLKTLRPDLLVCAFSQKADPAFLDLPRLGCLNVHFSLLPQHRGREPLFHAMLAGQRAGVSVHWMAPELDAGPVVFHEPLETAGFRTLHQLILAACTLATRVVPAAIQEAQVGRPAEADARPATPLAGWPSAEDVARFKARGLRFV